MLKLIGSVLILLSGTLAGFYQANQFASRPKQIRELTLMLQRLLTEINYSYRPLAEALSQIGKQASEPLGRLFISAADHMNSSQGLSAQELPACDKSLLEPNGDEAAGKRSDSPAQLQPGNE